MIGEEIVKVIVSKHQCDEASGTRWKVGVGRVLLVERTFRKPILLGELQLNDRNYERVINDFRDETILISKAEGVELSIIGGKVNRIIYGPTAKDQDLACDSRSRGADRFIPWFDKYGNISFDHEKRRLDNFAKQLIEHGSSSIGQVVVYPSPVTKRATAQKRAQRARSYLIRTSGLGRNRILARIGRPRGTSETELYILPEK